MNDWWGRTEHQGMDGVAFGPVVTLTVGTEGTLSYCSLGTEDRCYVGKSP